MLELLKHLGREKAVWIGMKKSCHFLTKKPRH